MVDVTEILVHWYAGRSISEVARVAGRGPQDDPQVPGAGGGGRAGAGRAGDGAGRSGRRWCGAGSRSWSTPGCGR